MNHFCISPVAVLVAALLGGSGVLSAFEFEVDRSKLTKRPSNEDLQARQGAQLSRLKAKEAERVSSDELKPRKEKEARDIVADSTILGHGGTWTIVPKGAVLHIPSFLKKRVGSSAREGKFVSWTDFARRNPGWLHLQSVQMKQARGKAPISEDTVKAYRQISRVVVAVCHGGPISVREFEEEKPKPAATGGVAGKGPNPGGLAPTEADTPEQPGIR